VQVPAGLVVIHVTLTRRAPARVRADQRRVGRIKDRSGRPSAPPADATGESRALPVAALNPHAGEGGLFGDEERRIIAPAVAKGRARRGSNVTGPIAADTLFVRAMAGEFDAVVAMYHDQGHVALKTLSFDRAVNVTLRAPDRASQVLPHGTAYDIAWKGNSRDVQPDRGGGVSPHESSRVGGLRRRTLAAL